MNTHILRIKVNTRYDGGHFVQRRYFGFLWIRVSVNLSSIEKCQKFIDDYPELIRLGNQRKKERKYTQKPQIIKIEEL